MSRRTLYAVLVLFVAAVVLLLLPVGTAVSQELTRVMVTNWPHPQHVDGTVAIKGPIRNAELVRRERIIVNPVKRSDTTRLINAGTLVTDGYPYAVLSIAGVVKGEIVKRGTVGAVLVPDEETIQTAFNEKGQIMFPLEVTAVDVSGSSPYFYSDQPRFVVGFPKYKILLYNTTEKTVEVDLFAYLTD